VNNKSWIYDFKCCLWAIIKLLLFNGMLNAQIIPFDNYDIRNGLPSNVINDIIQDKKGYIWFATQVGVSKFDGYTFRNYGIADGLPVNEIESIIEDSKGRIWAGTLGGGVAVFDKGKWTYKNRNHGLCDDFILKLFEDRDGFIWCISQHNGISRVSDDTITTYTVSGGISHNTIYCHLIDNANNLYLGTINGLTVLSKNNKGGYKIKTMLANISIPNIIQDKQGNIWISAWDDGIYRYDGKSLFHYDQKEGLPAKNVICILEDDDGKIWAGLKDAGVIYYENNRFNVISNTELQAATIMEMMQDKNKRIWARSMKEGIFMIDSKIVKRITTNNGLSDNIVNKIFIDSDGNIWICSVSGISKLGKKPFEIFNVNFGLPGNDILCTFADDDGNIWGGSYKGPFLITQTGKVRTFNEKYGLTANTLTTFKITADNENKLWLGTYFGITCFDGNRFHTYINPLWQERGNAIYDIIIDQQNKFLLAIDGGLFEFSEGRYNAPEKFKQLNNKDIRSIKKDKNNNLWVCTSEGVYIIGEYNLLINLSNGLSNNSCNDIYIDSSGVAWIATDNGLNKILLKPDGNYYFSVLTTYEGLLSNTIMFVTGDRADNIWIGHEKGLSRLNLADNSIRTYTGIDGFAPLETYLKAVTVDAANNVWIGTVSGLVKYNPDFDRPQINPPRLYITAVEFYNDSTDIFQYASRSDSSTGLPSKLVLPYNKNNLVFKYIGLHYANTVKNRYRYMLEGYDEKWSEITTTTTTHPYQKIPHGSYNFKVIAANCDGIWSEPVTFTFIIKPPFWKTAWFITLVIVLGIFMVYFIVKIRVRKLQHDKKVLEEKVKERTQEIQRQRDHIAEINREITDSIMYAQRIQSAVLPDESYISQHLKEYFILFKPRDIVSGDFYWVNSKDSKTIIVAADCTGHGVPGAFMSMLGVSLLNEITSSSKDYSAADILNELRDNVKSTLSQTGKKDEAKDGMDLALCIIDNNNRKAQYAGAYNPLLLVKNGEMIVLKADKMPIGIHIANEKPFTNNDFIIDKGDVIYMFSDGYADQFGGPENKKFKSCNFRDLLFQNHQKPMAEQKEILEQVFNSWKGNYAQIDDILVIGFRY
jgi:ligand-binding sensor domain-containing protein/serine phosphatase RsbU (regulator of sigma subunit)